MPPRPARFLKSGRAEPDSALVARASSGEREAFEELVRRHTDGLYAIVRRLGLPGEAAEEVAQETFLRAWRAIGSFRGDAGFFTWLYQIGLNEAKRELRRRHRRVWVRSLDEDDVLEPIDSRPDSEALLMDKELRVALARSVRALRLKYRAPIVLCDVEGLSVADAAAILGLSEAAFKSRLRRARLAVRDEVARHLEARP